MTSSNRWVRVAVVLAPAISLLLALPFLVLPPREQPVETPAIETVLGLAGASFSLAVVIGISFSLQGSQLLGEDKRVVPLLNSTPRSPVSLWGAATIAIFLVAGGLASFPIGLSVATARLIPNAFLPVAFAVMILYLVVVFTSVALGSLLGVLLSLLTFRSGRRTLLVLSTIAVGVLLLTPAILLLPQSLLPGSSTGVASFLLDSLNQVALGGSILPVTFPVLVLGTVGLLLFLVTVAIIAKELSYGYRGPGSRTVSPHARLAGIGLHVFRGGNLLVRVFILSIFLVGVSAVILGADDGFALQAWVLPGLGVLAAYSYHTSLAPSLNAGPQLLFKAAPGGEIKFLRSAFVSGVLTVTVLLTAALLLWMATGLLSSVRFPAMLLSIVIIGFVGNATHMAFHHLFPPRSRTDMRNLLNIAAAASISLPVTGFAVGAAAEGDVLLVLGVPSFTAFISLAVAWWALRWWSP